MGSVKNKVMICMGEYSCDVSPCMVNSVFFMR